MKAMIFAAGLGSRLKPITDSKPKALVTVSGKTLLQHTIEKLKTNGVDEIIINLHHFPDQIINFIKANNYFDIRIEFSDERDKLLDTGGAVKKAEWFFDDNQPFLIHNVDIFSDINLNKLFMHHIESGSEATLVCSKRETTRYLLFDKEYHLTGWINKNTGDTKSPFTNYNPSEFNELAFSGIHVLQPSVFKYMKKWPEKFSIIDFYISVCNDISISAYAPADQRTIDVGKPEALKEAEEFLGLAK